MNSTFYKGVVLGAVTSALVLAGAAAYAATGGNFILGHANSANATSGLSANLASSPALDVSNSSGGPAASFESSTAVPPFAVNSKKKVVNLNADMLNGMRANGVGRIAMASSETLVGGFSFSTLATVTITTPAKGFVRLDGSVFAWDGSAPAPCGDCELAVKLHDVSSGADSPRAFLLGGENPNSGGFEVPVSWVFPVTSGTHSYTLDAGQVDFSGGPLMLYNPLLIAQFVPYGGTGSPTSLGTSPIETSPGVAHVGAASDG